MEEDSAFLQITHALPGVTPLRRCDAGCYGAVFIARDQTGRKIAVKVIPRGAENDPGWARERAGLEKWCQCLASHPHLISVYQAGFTQDAMCYSMELADNINDPTSLDKYQADTVEHRIRREGRMKLPEIIRITSDALDGLEAIHAAGLLHRDIKPANLLFVGNQLKIGDIGLVTPNEAEASVVGTPAYQAPQSAGSTALPADDVDPDLYALGKTIYCMMTGLSAKNFPALPNDFIQHPGEFRELNRFLQQVCAPVRAQRFAGTADFRNAFQQQVIRAFEQRRKRLLFWLKIAANFAGLFLLLFVLHLLTRNPVTPIDHGHGTPHPPAIQQPIWEMEIISALTNAKRVLAASLFTEEPPAGWSISTVPADTAGSKRAAAAVPAARKAGGIRSLTLTAPALQCAPNFELYFELTSEPPLSRLRYELLPVSTRSGAIVLEYEVTPFGIRQLTGNETAASEPEPFPADIEVNNIWGLRLIGKDGLLRCFYNGDNFAGETPINSAGPWQIAVTLETAAGGELRLEKLILFRQNLKDGIIAKPPEK